MDAEKLKVYEGLVDQLEEPIREIVPAIWHLPFVIDTGHTCSGHVYENSTHTIHRPETMNFWYPHRAMIEVAFAINEDMAQARDTFRDDLRAVEVTRDGVTLSFHGSYSRRADQLPSGRGGLIPNINEMFEAEIPRDLPESEQNVVLFEGLLVVFWEKVATVMRKHNPSAKIGPIVGSFRKVLNWDHWETMRENHRANSRPLPPEEW